MKLSFLNRDKELSLLVKAFAANHGTFCCLYGRRRTGKSRLLQTALPPGRSMYYVGDEREPILQRESLARLIADSLPGFDKVHYPDWFSLLERWWKDSAQGSVLVLDEFPYMVRTSPELPSILQKLIDLNSSKQCHLVICGSSQRMMHGIIMDSSSPLYGRALHAIKVLPLGPEWIGDALGLQSPESILNAYSVWGGIPWYWELALDYSSLWEAVENLILDPMSILHNEPKRLLLDDVRDPVQSASILSVIGQGAHRMSEIAARTGKPSTSLSRPVQKLMDLGLVKKDIPFGASERNCKTTLYKLNDPFIAFWFRHVEPNRSSLESGAVKHVLSNINTTFKQHSAEILEQLVRQNIHKLQIHGKEWRPAYRWWGTGINRERMEIDVVAESVDGTALLVGEVKLHITGSSTNKTHKELVAKTQNFPGLVERRRVINAIFTTDTRNLKIHPDSDLAIIGLNDLLLAARHP